jgi:hypothetical protein
MGYGNPLGLGRRLGGGSSRWLGLRLPNPNGPRPQRWRQPKPTCVLYNILIPPQSDRQSLRTFRLVLNSVNNVEGSPLVGVL